MISVLAYICIEILLLTGQVFGGDERFIGCWYGSSLVHYVLDTSPVLAYSTRSDLTLEMCVTECAAQGYKYTGILVGFLLVLYWYCLTTKLEMS